MPLKPAAPEQSSPGGAIPGDTSEVAIIQGDSKAIAEKQAPSDASSPSNSPEGGASSESSSGSQVSSQARSAGIALLTVGLVGAVSSGGYLGSRLGANINARGQIELQDLHLRFIDLVKAPSDVLPDEAVAKRIGEAARAAREYAARSLTIHLGTMEGELLAIRRELEAGNSPPDERSRQIEAIDNKLRIIDGANKRFLAKGGLGTGVPSDLMLKNLKDTAESINRIADGEGGDRTFTEEKRRGQILQSFDLAATSMETEIEMRKPGAPRLESQKAAIRLQERFIGVHAQQIKVEDGKPVSVRRKPRGSVVALGASLGAAILGGAILNGSLGLAEPGATGLDLDALGERVLKLQRLLRSKGEI